MTTESTVALIAAVSAAIGALATSVVNLLKARADAGSRAQQLDASIESAQIRLESELRAELWAHAKDQIDSLARELAELRALLDIERAARRSLQAELTQHKQYVQALQEAAPDNHAFFTLDEWIARHD